MAAIHIDFFQSVANETDATIKWFWKRIENGAAMHISSPFDTEAQARASAETDINGYKSYPEARLNGPLNPHLPEHDVPAPVEAPEAPVVASAPAPVADHTNTVAPAPVESNDNAGQVSPAVEAPVAPAPEADVTGNALPESGSVQGSAPVAGGLDTSAQA